MKKRIVIIGATSAIAQHCARLWIAEAPIDIVLVGRDKDKTDQVAADLRVLSLEANVQSLQANFTEPDQIRLLVDQIAAEGALDTVLIAHGSLPNQSICQQDLNANHEALLINGISPVLFAESFVGHMEKVNRGTLAIISSVAGERGRKSNYIYGAAKGLVTQYSQGLQHRFAHTGINIVLIKPGPTDTPMTAHLKVQGYRMALAIDVAKLITQKIRQGKRTIYAPVKWALIMMIIRHLPRVVFNKLNI